MSTRSKTFVFTCITTMSAAKQVVTICPKQYKAVRAKNSNLEVGTVATDSTTPVSNLNY